MSELQSHSFNSLFFQYINQISGHVSADVIEPAIEQFIELTEQLNAMTTGITGLEGDLEKAKTLLDFFYIDALFSEPEKQSIIFNEVDFNLLDVVRFRTGHTSLLAIILADLSRAIGFNAEVFQTSKKSLVRIEISANEYVFIDVATGHSLDWQQVQTLFLNGTNDKTVDDDIAALADEFVIKQLLVSYKSVLLTKSNYQQSLAICEALVKLEPDNPYHRRDRGYLLEQLECKPLAIADYQYFVEQCPDDPIAQLLKTQLEQNSAAELTFH